MILRMIPEKYLKPYDPKTTEDGIYSEWLESGYFNPDKLPARHKKPFSIVLPPPNVTGTLHMGHSLTLAIEDIMVRFKRMQGFKTLWIPGTDHAAIATQSKVESEIYKKEGKRRHDLGRAELLRRVEIFAKESHDTIVNQIKKMGASIDWSREAYTLDAKRELAVRTAFKKMYDEGLIYRGNRIVNWDPKDQTTISDDEIVYVEGKGKFYTFKYSKDFPISIATTRPETKVGDTGVAVHPDDPRYAQYVGKEYDIDFAGEKIHVKIVADKEVDKDFGTGAVGVTPAHSHVDAEIAARNGLPSKQVINEYTKMSVEGALLKDKKVADARAAVVEWLKSEGLLEKEEEISQNVATAERTGGVIEPLPKLQWFIDVNKKFRRGLRKVSLKDLMKNAVTGGGIKILPDRFEKVYLHWIENLRDWCISRQIWFGHQVPVWYKGDEIYCGLTKPDDSDWEQDEDTLDTWFSSGLWTFSTLGWPAKTEDFKMYHPTSVLETGYDIIFFWVARMILMSTYLLDEIPFETVYLHGLVRNNDGTKMSKSQGAIDPLLMSEKYGTDALRMSLIIGNGPGNDTRMSEDKVRGYKNFSNKIWNIARFVLSSTEGFDYSKKAALTNDDKKIIADFEKTIADVTADMENFRYYLAGEKMYAYVWHEFADKIIEASKEKISKGDTSSKWTLLYILENSIRVLHPFMPFVTEEIWKDVPHEEKTLLMISKWPS